jgi:hypothetical protein
MGTRSLLDFAVGGSIAWLQFETSPLGRTKEERPDRNRSGLSSLVGSERIALGSAIDLTATPAADSLFAGWSGDATGADPSVTVTIDAAKTVIAAFTLRPYTTGDVSGDGAIDLLDVRLCARIAQGYLAGTPSQRAAADVDGDGDVDADDVTILSEYVLGARPTLP